MGLFQKKQDDSSAVASALYQELRQLRSEVHAFHGEVQQHQRSALKAEALDGLGQKLDRRLAQVQSAAQAQPSASNLDQMLDRFRSDVQKRLDSLSQALLTLRESRTATGGPSVADLMRQIETRESERSESLRQELTGLRTWLGKQLPANAPSTVSSQGSWSKELETRFGSLFEQMARTAKSTDSIQRAVEELQGQLPAGNGSAPTPDRWAEIEKQLAAQFETLSELKRNVSAPASDESRPKIEEKLRALDGGQREIASSLEALRRDLHGNGSVEDVKTDLAGLRQQWTELQGAVASGEALAALGVRMEKLLEDERTARLEEVRAAQAEIESLRSRLDERLGQLKRLDVPLEELKQKSDRNAASAEMRAAQTREAIDALHQSVSDLPAVDLTPLQSNLTAIRTEIERAGKSRLKESMSLQSEHEKTRQALVTLDAEIAKRLETLSQGTATREEMSAQARLEEKARIAAALLPFDDVLSEVARSADRLAAEPEPARRSLFRGPDPLVAEQRRRSASWAEGVRLVQTRLEKILTDFGVQPISALGQPFDPEHHVAVGSMSVEGRRDGEIIEERLRGYRIGERVLRYSEVVVGKNGEVKTES